METRNKRIPLIASTILSLFLTFAPLAWAGDTLRIGVMSDIHYLSPKLMQDGGALENYISAGGKNVRVVPAVLQQVFAYYQSLTQLDVLLVSGDITKDGEKQSHLDFVDMLKPLQKRGTRVFVIPGNHDINMPNALAYMGSDTQKTDNISADEFAQIYHHCGYGSALSRDSSSLSYLAQLDQSTWLLTLDAARYEDYTTRSLSSGKLNKQTEQWALEILDRAKEQNIEVMGMMHWGMVEHIMSQATYFKDYLVHDWERLSNLFTDRGMKVIFTGHFHANDITSRTSNKGNIIYDIETGALGGYPFVYREIDYWGEGMNVRSHNVLSLSDDPNMAADDRARMRSLAFGLTLNMLNKMGLNLPEPISANIADIMSEVFVMHLEGDEVMSDQLAARLDSLRLLLGSDNDWDPNDLLLDFAPADNNVLIRFKKTID